MNASPADIQVPSVCSGCLGEPDQVVNVTDSHGTPPAGLAAGRTATVTLALPICEACLRRYRRKRVKTFGITFVIVLSAFASSTLFGYTLKTGLFWGVVFGIFLGLTTARMLGKPFFQSEGLHTLIFENDEYQRQFEELNRDLLQILSSDENPPSD